jgi:hypothetical protein
LIHIDARVTTVIVNGKIAPPDDLAANDHRVGSAAAAAAGSASVPVQLPTLPV